MCANTVVFQGAAQALLHECPHASAVLHAYTVHYAGAAQAVLPTQTNRHVTLSPKGDHLR